MSALHDGQPDMPPDAAVLLNGVIKQVCVVGADYFFFFGFK